MQTQGLRAFNWSPRASGVRLLDSVATRLEDLWRNFNQQPRQPLIVVKPSAVEGLRTEIVRYAKGRSRSLRDTALTKSGGVCAACVVDYSKVLDGKGIRVLQVHHRRQLAANDKPGLTRLADLAVLCANCHSLVHMNPQKAMSVEELRRLLRRLGSA